MKVSIIGLGKQNLSDHIPALLRRSDIEIASVCDPDNRSYENFVSLFPTLKKSAKYFNNFKDIPLSEIDFCVVSVPHDKYPDIVKYLCENKIPFMKEKPFARNLAEAIKITKIKDIKKYCFVCTQRRFSSLYSIAKNSIPDIGTPFMFNATYKLNITDPAEGWRGNAKIAGGGCILDMGYHIVDQLVWWFGKPDHLFARISSLANSKLANKYTEDSATISFSYNTGLHGVITLSRSAGEKIENYALHGTDGHIEGNRKYLKIKNKLGDIRQEESLAEDSVLMDKQLNFFLKRISDKSGFDETIEANIRNMELIEEIYKTSNNLN